MEKWGHGIELIFKECEAVGLHKPEYRSDKYFVDLIIRFKKPLNAVAEKTAQKVAQKFSGKIAASLMEVIELLNDKHTITKAELSNTLNITIRTVSSRHKDLQDIGVLRRECGKKSGRWEIINE